MIQNRTRFDSAVLSALTQRGIGMVIVNRRHPDRFVQVSGSAHNEAGRRIAQYRRSLDETWRTRWSVMLVKRKLRMQYRLLNHALHVRPDRRRTLTRAMVSLQERIDCLRDPTAHIDRERVRGVEGAGAAAYFKGFQSLFAPSLEFNGRNRRPPKDPVNACLSLGYTLLHAEAVFALQTAGLDPLLGFYHDLSFGRESLACDLVEPLRPTVDRWVWGMFRERNLRSENFSLDKGACLLNKAGRQTFYRDWESQARLLRRKFRRYARLLVHSLTL